MNQPGTDRFRIVVIGSSGSGKTTFARALAQQLQARHIEIDSLYHMRGWQARLPDELRALLTDAMAAPSWVLDGNYTSLRPLIWPQATHLIWLNYPFPLTFQRLLRRTIKRIVTREVLFGGNLETFRQTFLSKESILLYMLKQYPVRRRIYRRIFDEDQTWTMKRLEFRHPREAAQYLEQMAHAV